MIRLTPAGSGDGVKTEASYTGDSGTARPLPEIKT
jgi:hypothetical protein